MCGIFGHYALNGADVALVERMAQRLAHRGPDGYGLHADPGGRFAFGAGRLAIIDLNAHPGVLFNEDCTTAVAFNGEIYNYQPLRAELEGARHQFSTRTDTEVIVHGYEQWGDDVLTHLRGMFAVAIWDRNRDRLLIARDRLGEKPLYFTDLGGGEFLFASEIKALYEHPGMRRAINREGLMETLSLGYVLPPHTLFEGVRKLAQGEALVLEHGQARVFRYWTPLMAEAEVPPYEEAVKQVRAAVEQAVRMQMMSDVPIGAFLSGGVDSTAVVGLMKRSLAPGQSLQTFTVGFDEPAGSHADRKFNVDARYAADVARQFGTEHHAIFLKQDESLSELLPRLIYHQDSLIAMPTIVQTAYVASLARVRNVPVLLNGEAGDELFMGYNHFRTDQTLSHYLKIPSLVRKGLLDPILSRLPGERFDSARKLVEKTAYTSLSERYLGWTHILGTPQINGMIQAAWMLPDSSPFEPILSQPRTKHFTDRLAFGNLVGFVGENSNMRVDKMCMAMSVEARSPLEDYKLVELALRLPLSYKLRGGDFKVVFKDALRDLLPEAVQKRPKWGFNPPASDWLRGPLQPLIKRYLSRDYVEAVGVFNPDAVARALHEHVVEHKYRLWEVWVALTFHLWHAIFMDQSLTFDRPIKAADVAAMAVIR
ncbi:MAG: asparagine synthase (glutamine-hydrolyzing) [Anaerolineae bacterium]